MIKEVNIMLQGKGGCGKSFAMTMFAQYALENFQDVPLYCYDTDTSNHTFSDFKELNVIKVDLIPPGQAVISQKLCDAFFASILENGSGRFIVDVGATAFQSVITYITENKLIQLLKDEGYTVNIHTVISPNQDLVQTVQGFLYLAEQISTGQDLVVWANQRNNEVLVEGVRFEDSSIYKDFSDKIKTVITLPCYYSDTFKSDIAEMMSEGLTFNECIKSADWSLFSRNRIKLVRDEFYSEIGKMFQPLQTSAKRNKG